MFSHGNLIKLRRNPKSRDSYHSNARLNRLASYLHYTTMATQQVPALSSFDNRATYSLKTDEQRLGLPRIPDAPKFICNSVLFGRTSLPTRMALLALPQATNSLAIARLVLGAIADAAGLTATATRLPDPWMRPHWTDAVIGWVAKRMQSEGEHPEEAAAEDGHTVSSQDDGFPTDALPEWYREIEPSYGKLVEIFEYDQGEVAAWAAVLAMAIAKAPTSDNITAFNERRVNMVRNHVPTGELKIFVPQSEFLTLDILQKVHRSFNTLGADRAVFIRAVVQNDGPLKSGPARIFYSLFRLTAGASMNPLLLILKAVTRYPQLRRLFPDLAVEFRAADDAIRRLDTAPESERLYLKIIFGNEWSPVPRGDINRLLGICVFVLSKTDNLVNYKGGAEPTYNDKVKILDMLDMPITETEQAVEVVRA